MTDWANQSGLMNPLSIAGLVPEPSKEDQEDETSVSEVGSAAQRPSEENLEDENESTQKYIHRLSNARDS